MRKLKFEIPESVQTELDARDAAQKKATVEELENGVFQLKHAWADDKRGVPNAFLRSALFGVVRRGRRAMVKDAEIAAWGDTKIKFTGEQLQQSDQDVWMACVEACKRAGRTEVVVGQRELLRLTGRKGRDTKRLFADLERLAFAGIKVASARHTYVGTLIHDATRDEKTGEIALSINPKMAALFGSAGATHIEAEQRHALSGDLSKWLQGYAISHKSSYRKPHLIGLEKLQVLCGAQSDIRKFRFNIKKSMHELKEQKIVAGWELENDVLKLWK